MRILALLWLAASGAAMSAPAPDLLACMRANVPDTVRVQSVEITSYDRTGGERTLRGRVFGSRDGGRARVMALIEAPQDLARAAFLIRDDEPQAEMYMYLPGVNRVKRLTGASLGGKLWNTDFSYNEFREVQTAFGGAVTTVEGDLQHEGRTVQAVQLSAAPGQTLYDSIRVLIDRETCVPLAAEFRRGGVVRKRLDAPAAQLRQSGRHWYGGELMLRDLLAGTRTRLRVLDVKVVERLSPSVFHPQQFYSAR